MAFDHDDYSDYITSDPVWDELRRERLSIAEYKCERCGDNDCVLEVHHLVYPEDLGDESIDDLEALCHSCHIIADMERESENYGGWDDENWDYRFECYADKRWPGGLPEDMSSLDAQHYFASWLRSNGEDYPSEWIQTVYGNASVKVKRPLLYAPIPFDISYDINPELQEIDAAFQRCRAGGKSYFDTSCYPLRTDAWRFVGLFVRSYIRYISSLRPKQVLDELCTRINAISASSMTATLFSDGMPCENIVDVKGDFSVREAAARVERSIGNVLVHLSKLQEGSEILQVPGRANDGRWQYPQPDILGKSEGKVFAYVYTTRSMKSRYFSDTLRQDKKQLKLVLDGLLHHFPDTQISCSLVGVNSERGPKTLETCSSKYFNESFSQVLEDEVEAIQNLKDCDFTPNPLCGYCPFYERCSFPKNT